MPIRVLLSQPGVRAIAIRTAKNILVLGATATIAFFSNNVFRTMANNAIKAAIEDYGFVKTLVRN